MRRLLVLLVLALALGGCGLGSGGSSSGPGTELTVYPGRDGIKRIFLGAKDRVNEQLDRPQSTYIRHFTATHQIDLVDADNATGRCYFAVIIDNGLDHWGRYVDHYVRIDDSWKFAHRRVTIDGRNADSWFAKS